MTTREKSPNGKSIVTDAVIGLPTPQIEMMTFRLIGTASLIMHKWSEKAIKQIEDKQQKKAQSGKEKRNPKAEYEASMHKDADGDYAFPSIGFKAAAVTAVTQISGITKVFARGAFHVDGEFVKIQGKPRMRTDMVRIGMGTADVRYRGEFPEWSTDITVRYNATVISREQILNLFQTAGFAVGIGEWRPERDGSFGTFRIANEGE